jgi:hypothetical protein
MRRQSRLQAAGHRRVKKVGGVVVGVALLLATVPAALAQDPGPVVAVGTGGGAAPSPDPAPEPAPQTGGGGGGGGGGTGGGQASPEPASPSPTPTTTPPSSTSSSTASSSSSSVSTSRTTSATSGDGTGVSPAERARERRADARRRREQARRERERRERQREQRLEAAIDKRTTKAIRSGFAAFETVLAGQLQVADTLAAAADQGVSEAAPAASREAADVSASGQASGSQALVVPTPGSSTFSALVPLLLGLLGAAVLLLGLAALPPAVARRSTLVARALEHRFEIGLLGTAVLASAAIGLLVTNLGG